MRVEGSPRGCAEPHPRASDGGFGLVEVMVAMLILLIMILAMTSVVITALSVTTANGTRATASEAVQTRIEDARRQSVAGSCDVIEAVVNTPATVYDGRGTPITITGRIAGCTRKTGSEQYDPAQVVRVTVTANSIVDGVSSPTPTAQTTTDIFMKFKTP
jgi:prepilin-type N-terminal cleavage/methylation domain-containing protein